MRFVLALLVVAALLAFAQRPDGAPATPAGAPASRTFAFAPGVAPHERDAFLAAVAAARPDARRLIEAVDGQVTVRVGPTGDDALGITRGRRGAYSVIVDQAGVAQRYGVRGISRVVLHELGHVVDHALVPADLKTRLDGMIPQGYVCEEGSVGACAAREERFAESFAKWATGDIGVDLYIGYKVLPPTPSLDAWGEPLAALAS